MDVLDCCIVAMIIAVVEDVNKVISLEWSSGGIPLLSGMTIELDNMNIENCANKFDWVGLIKWPINLKLGS